MNSGVFTIWRGIVSGSYSVTHSQDEKKPCSKKTNCSSQKNHLTHLNDISHRPEVTFQIGYLTGLSRSLSSLNWAKYLDYRLQSWKSIPEQELKKEEEKKCGSRLHRHSYSASRAGALKEEIESRSQTIDKVMELFSDPKSTLQTIVHSLRTAHCEHRIFSFFIDGNDARKIVEQKDKIPVVFGNESGVYLNEDFIEYLTQNNGEEKLSALFLKAGVLYFLNSQSIDEDLSHLISDDVERFFLGYKFNEGSPEEIDIIESALDKALDDFTEVLPTRDQKDINPDQSLFFTSVALGSYAPEMIFVLGDSVSTNGLDPILQTPFVDLTVQDVVEENLDVLENDTKGLLDVLHKKNIINNHQYAMLTLIACDEYHAELAKGRNYQALENLTAESLNIYVTEATKLIRGNRFPNSENKYPYSAIAHQLSKYLSYASSNVTSCEPILSWLKRNSSLSVSFNLKISDSTPNTDEVYKTIISDMMSLVKNARENNILTEDEFSAVYYFLQGEDSNSKETTQSLNAPDEILLNSAIEKINLNYTDLFFKMYNTMKSKEVSQIVAQLSDSELPIPTLSEQINRMSDAIGIKKERIFAFMIENGFANMPEVPEANITSPSVVTESTPNTLSRQIDKKIKLFFRNHLSAFSDFEEFQKELKANLKSSVDGSEVLDNDIDKRLEALSLNNVTFTIYKAYLRLKDFPGPVGLVSLKDETKKISNNDIDLHLGEIKEKVENALPRILDETLDIKYPTWNSYREPNTIDNLIDFLGKQSQPGNILIYYSTYVRKNGYPPSQVEMAKELKKLGIEDASEENLHTYLESINKNLSSLGYSSLVLTEERNNTARKIIAACINFEREHLPNEALSLQAIYKRLSPPMATMEDFCEALISSGNNSENRGFNILEDFDPSLTTSLDILRDEAVLFLCKKDDSKNSTNGNSLSDELGELCELGGFYIGEVISKDSQALKASSSAEFIKGIKNEFGDKADIILHAIDISEGDLKIIWHYWKLKNIAPNDKVDVRKLVESCNADSVNVDNSGVINVLKKLEKFINIENLFFTSLNI